MWLTVTYKIIQKPNSIEIKIVEKLKIKKHRCYSRLILKHAVPG